MIRDAATQRQVQAAEPQTSTWLSANAGSGKTRVLTDRVARLLLDGVDPQNILCLTYTKAAATEMQNRLFKRLGSWAMMAPDPLRKELATLGVEGRIDDSRIATARTLFARAIETPGGLRIQTIHSFCAGLLRRFPLEAGISPQFQEMEDRAADLLRLDIVETMSVETPDLVAALATNVSDDGLIAVLKAIISARAELVSGADDAKLRAAFDLSSDARREDALGIAIRPSDKALSDAVTEAFATQTPTYVKFAATLAATNFEAPNWDTLKELVELFLYKSGKNKDLSKSANFPQSNHAKAVDALAPIVDEVHDWMDRVEQAVDFTKAFDAYARTKVFYAFGSEYINRYDTQKQLRGVLDFDDLISKARDLLTDPRVAQWVLFRLDGGIDHILVDEAQDTSPSQWAVIKPLAEEFSTGEGVSPQRERTIFVVGDKKQSIYSFQGADPEGFDRMRHHFQTELEKVNQPFRSLDLEYSFRSSQAIMDTVNLVFTGPHTGDIPWDDTPHRAFKDQMPGRVDLWPSIEHDNEAANLPFDWTSPVDAPSPLDNKVVLARTIAAEIKRMLAEETIPDEIGQTGQYNHRRITEGDILILVQRRSPLFSEIIRACKTIGLNVAGADRLKVGAELAVKDISAVLRFLALPEDDLSLAEALKSPLFGWSEQDLYTLAHHRSPGQYLWQALRASSDHQETNGILDDLLNRADFLRPYDLINRLLTRHNGRQRLLARLGHEAEDGIDALLNQALGYERSAVPDLTGFLEWMQTDDVTIKRQMDSAEDRIRVMTVHGAKGLEAPIVFLPDTAKRPVRANSVAYSKDGVVLWAPKTDEMPSVIQQLRQEKIEAEERERRRLLYVAMTRAESWLIVCAAGDVGTGFDSWHSTVGSGLDHLGIEDTEFADIGTGKRFATGTWRCGTLTGKRDVAEIPMARADYVALPKAVVQPITHSPSDLGGAKIIPGDLGAEHEDDAKLRGVIIHLLLEHLPDAPETERLQLGQKLLSSIEGSASLADTDTLIDDAIALMSSPGLKDIFASTALTEVDVTADVPLIGRLHGAIDRLIVGEDHIHAIDYKSNRLVPNTPHETPDGILRQMAAYRAMIAAVWPDHQIDVSVLWTATAELMTIPHDLLTDALNRVTVADASLDVPGHDA